MYFCSNSWQNKIAQLGAGAKRHFLFYEGAMRIARRLGWVISPVTVTKYVKLPHFQSLGREIILLELSVLR